MERQILMFHQILVATVRLMTTSLKDFRKNQGVSQAWLAERIGIHRVTLARYEDGRTKPPASFYYQLAYLFRYPVDEVLSLNKKNEIQS
jgi:DNA-binding XRE family transcriptional regulator